MLDTLIFLFTMHLSNRYADFLPLWRAMVFVFEGYKRLWIQVTVKAFGTIIQKFECCVPCDDCTACGTLIIVIKRRTQMEPIAKNTDNYHHLLTLTKFVFL